MRTMPDAGAPQINGVPEPLVGVPAVAVQDNEPPIPAVQLTEQDGQIAVMFGEIGISYFLKIRDSQTVTSIESGKLRITLGCRQNLVPDFKLHYPSVKEVGLRGTVRLIG